MKGGCCNIAKLGTILLSASGHALSMSKVFQLQALQLYFHYQSNHTSPLPGQSYT
jgi:hypothetical protein